MNYESALAYVRSSTRLGAIHFFEVSLDRESDLDKLSTVVESIGWVPEVDRDARSVRIFRPLARAADLN